MRELTYTVGHMHCELTVVSVTSESREQPSLGYNRVVQVL